MSIPWDIRKTLDTVEAGEDQDVRAGITFDECFGQSKSPPQVSEPVRIMGVHQNFQRAPLTGIRLPPRRPLDLCPYLTMRGTRIDHKLNER